MSDQMNRRRFLTVLGVTGGGVAALGACGVDAKPAQKLIPYLVQPEDQVPGIATWYATTCRECPAGCGLHAKVREGRAVKLEGNPESPLNHGHLCARGQAGLEGVYNPDRVAGARYILSFGADFLDTWLSPVGYQHAFSRAHGFNSARADAMAKLVFVGPRMTLTGMNADEWIAPVPGTEGVLALALAAVIVRERLAPLPPDVGRLKELLNRHTPGVVARVAGVGAEAIERLAREFAAVRGGRGGLAVAGVGAGGSGGLAREWGGGGGGGGGLAVAGGMAAHYPNGADIVAAVNVLNYVAGTVGSLVKFGADLAIGATNTFADLASLTSDMAAGKVALLFVHGANPAYSLPGAFQQALGKVGYKVSFSSYMDETAAACDLILPDHHPLEQWGDSRPRAGVIALQQPVVQPVFDSRPTGDVVLKLAGRPGTFQDYLQSKWRARQKTNFDQYWMDALARGGVYAEAPSRARPVHLAATAAGKIG